MHFQLRNVECVFGGGSSEVSKMQGLVLGLIFAPLLVLSARQAGTPSSLHIGVLKPSNATANNSSSSPRSAIKSNVGSTQTSTTRASNSTSANKFSPMTSTVSRFPVTSTSKPTTAAALAAAAGDVRSSSNPAGVSVNRNNARMQGVVFSISASNSPPPQVPGVWEALVSNMQNSKAKALQSDEQAMILASSVPGQDYPAYREIPDTGFKCDYVNQAGFYADTEGGCQVFRRCDLDGNLWSFLCPNQTLFNQITLVCDWFFNVDCAKAKSFYDYSNSRLYHELWRLLDDPPAVINTALFA